MSTDAAHKSWWQISEVAFGLPLLVAMGLQLAVPLSFPGGWLRLAILPVGIACAVVGVAFIVLARRAFARHGQPTDPGRPTSRIVTSGVFSISRNPIYLGAACFVAGMALSLNLPWVLVLLLLSLVVCHYMLIAPEEKYLGAKFGEEYRAYAAAVHRWIGRANST